ncbi:MAG: threonylcarbamoyl-AMP synthase [Candidatus Omnitrophica bacterium]|nr:threonylcarbamoyl-AMP synthase [Candidatus Omnitrophota bacterium]
MKRILVDTSNIDQELIKIAAQTILQGGIVAIPTETVYGLAGLARQEIADKLYTMKQRAKDKPFSIALGDVNKAISNYFEVMPPFSYRLVEKFWPGPLTIVYYNRQGESIGIRVPAHAVANEILKEVNKAVYLPSANLSGQKEALMASEVEAVFDGNIDLIVDGGKCSYSKTSTVLDLTAKPFKVLREGVVSEEEIAKIFIRKRIIFVCTGNSCRSPLAQYLLEKYLREDRPYFDERYEIISAGTSAYSGAKISSAVEDILSNKEGIDSSVFRSRLLDRYHLLSSDLIFTMEERQRQYILNFEPSTEGRVFNLKEFLPERLKKDIPDPIGRDINYYNEVYSLIKEAIFELRDWV